MSEKSKWIVRYHIFFCVDLFLIGYQGIFELSLSCMVQQRIGDFCTNWDARQKSIQPKKPKQFGQSNGDFNPQFEFHRSAPNSSCRLGKIYPPVIVTTKSITFLVANPYTSLFSTVPGWGVRSKV